VCYLEYTFDYRIWWLGREEDVGENNMEDKRRKRTHCLELGNI
jgi:hypothetical protein